MSRLARWSEGVLEACWLVAAAVVPVFFDAHAASPFEPSKVALVRTLALLMAAAWVVRRLEGGSGETAAGPRLWRTPLTLPLLAYVAALTAGACISLQPAASFWGAAVRLDGLLTLFAYLVVFASVAARLRRPDALERLLDVIVAASVPVCLYSLVQAAGLDPIDWRGYFEQGRIASTLGGPTFAGAYLVVVMPLTLAQGVHAWRSRAPGWRSLVYALAFLLQGVALVLTGSRGPWIAAVAGLFGMGVLLGAVRRRRLWTALAFLPALAFGLFVLLLNVPRGPLEPLRDKPALRRLGHLFDKATPDLSGRARFLIWKGAFALSLPRPPLVDGDGRPDRFARLRPVFGYGMETLALGFHAVYDPEFNSIERRHHLQSEEPLERRPIELLPVPDRSHNEFWDSVVFGGWLGGAAHLAFYWALLALALRVLGLETRGGRWRFTGYLGVAGLLVGAGASDAFGWPYLGVGLPFGLAAGFVLHALLAAFRDATPLRGPRAWLGLGLAGALLGHFVDVELGLSVATSKLYFWILAGVLAAASLEPALLGSVEPAAGTDAEAGRARSRSSRLGESLRGRLPASAIGGLLAAALLATLLFDFVKPSSQGFLGTLLALVGGRRGPGQLPILGIGLLSAGLVIALERRRAGGASAWLGWAVALGAAFAFAAVQLQTVTAVRDQHSDLLALEAFSHWVLAQFALLLVALALLLGAALSWPWPAPRFGRFGRVSAAAALALLLGGAWLAARVALFKSEAETLQQLGAVFERSSRYPIAAALYQRAAEIDPHEPRYPLYVGKAALEASRQRVSAADAWSWVRLSQDAFERARALSPYDPGHLANLARLMIRRSELAERGQAEVDKQKAEDLYARALRLSPSNVALLDEWAIFQLVRRGRLDAAEANLKRSLELDPSYYLTLTALGQLYTVRGQSGSGDKLADYRTAIAYYDRSLGLQNSARTAVARGLLSLEAEDKASAARRLEDALRLGPEPGAARRVHQQLARLYQELGQPQQAAAHAAQAGPPGPD